MTDYNKRVPGVTQDNKGRTGMKKFKNRVTGGIKDNKGVKGMTEDKKKWLGLTMSDLDDKAEGCDRGDTR